MNGATFVWVVDEDGLMEEFGYPRVGEKIPDHYGELSDGRRVLFEAKEFGNVNRARTQLEAGLENMRRLKHRVDLIGMIVGKLDGEQPWRRGVDGLLYSRKRLGATPVKVNGLPVMVQETRDG